jgi:hypothetical protein
MQRHLAPRAMASVVLAPSSSIRPSNSTHCGRKPRSFQADEYAGSSTYTERHPVAARERLREIGRSDQDRIHAWDRGDRALDLQHHQDTGGHGRLERAERAVRR